MLKGIAVIFVCSLIVDFALSDVVDSLRVSDAAKDTFRQASKACIGADYKPMDIFNVDKGIFASEKEVGCYYKCYMEKGGTLLPNGELNGKRIFEIVPLKVQEKVKTCLKKHDDACKTAYEAYKCYILILKENELL